jgi:hypothetical protein
MDTFDETTNSEVPFYAPEPDPVSRTELRAVLDSWFEQHFKETHWMKPYHDTIKAAFGDLKTRLGL